MSITRVFRFIVGTLLAGVILGFLLPVAGVPSSRFLPPAHVWDRAQGYGRGVATGKHYDVTGNWFNIGAHLYFVSYTFKAPPFAPKDAKPGPAQDYTGTVRVEQADYDDIVLPEDAKRAEYKAQQTVPVVPGQYLRVKYETTDPQINGVVARYDQGRWVQWGGRSIDGDSALFSGWLGWVFLTLALGFGIMMLLERFAPQENI